MEPLRASPILRKSVKIACVQFASGPDKTINLDKARSLVFEAASKGAGIVILPECFNSPYSTTEFSKYAEVLQPSPPREYMSPTFHALSRMAKETGVYLIGGSIPELEADTNKIYNTSLVFAPSGTLQGFHRKSHLFNVEFDTMIFRESDVLSPGNEVTVIDLDDYGKIGLGICFDIRFPEPAAIAARSGAFALIYPSAFNTTTGPLHWELLSRSRALDNQTYVAMCSQSFDPASGYPAWGYSLVVDPLGQTVSSADRDEAIVYADLEDYTITNCRRQIPLETSRRFDLYVDVNDRTSIA
ncbi:Omega-amidase nit3 [Fusarium oxysporum]|nr:Omega-amidase nit3 [Fusarium oxysporum]KAJ4118630.1 Omega-amidase nit3 [Fusarium oxysporum]KAJ4212912.1 Omega-amidase nit3 [Fusarium oxysporum]KAJ4251556.1 Omega-amidase nit3 [Fusarium oxysporum]